ncbi:MAG: hypothetical protein GXP45_06920 [bacterium]|nr:hypothetical protein [bacterium]
MVSTALTCELYHEEEMVSMLISSPFFTYPVVHDHVLSINKTPLLVLANTSCP